MTNDAVLPVPFLAVVNPAGEQVGSGGGGGGRGAAALPGTSGQAASAITYLGQSHHGQQLLLE